MIALDSNILVYAHRADSRWHNRAKERIRELAEGSAPWLIPWPCIHEFLAIVTHPKIYNPPTPLLLALDQVDLWLQSPSLVLTGESLAYWPVFREMAAKSRIEGPLVHDARLAAICMEQGVEELWTADRDFSRFPKLKVRNPLIS
jgi:toxin-antitoxin system PIN domain toxin